MPKSTIKLALLISILSAATAAAPIMTSPAMAAAAENPVSPEHRLVEQAFALQGKKLPVEKTLNELGRIYQSYKSEAKPEGQAKRYQSALVELGVFPTDEQAKEFMDDSLASGQAIAETAGRDAAPSADAVLAQLERLANLHLNGQEFSACSAVGWGAAAAGATAVVGFFVRMVEKCPPGTNTDGSGAWNVNQWGPTLSCSAPPITAHPILGDTMMGGGGAALVLTVILLATGHAGCQ